MKVLETTNKILGMQIHQDRKDKNDFLKIITYQKSYGASTFKTVSQFLSQFM